MTSDEKYPAGTPIPHIDSFEVVEADGPELTDEERAWPVVALQPRIDSFEVIDPVESQLVEELEVVIRVRCAASATPAEVTAFVEQLRSAVEGVRTSAASSFPVQISLPTSIS
ncbi:hypothetical protein J8F10_34250 [Gemmata sp. G18]|uniref:Uncharacterized protein n=1 Tax=Gemmata palustris TaxID=2822762 RepID=A0ABS5C338_9BACT|nr:hypothetical protein [Gemmata palustris]MBP3960318.1 hypothetical protein [Gemmata palustris]